MVTVRGRVRSVRHSCVFIRSEQSVQEAESCLSGSHFRKSHTKIWTQLKTVHQEVGQKLPNGLALRCG